PRSHPTSLHDALPIFVLGIETAEEAAAAYRRMQASLEAHGLGDAFEGALVQEMVTGGVECLVGVVNDALFGPLIAFGLGGTVAEDRKSTRLNSSHVKI